MVSSLDVGDGFYEPGRNLVYSYDKREILRKVSNQEADIIKSKYRYEPVLRDIKGQDDSTISAILTLERQNTAQ